MIRLSIKNFNIMMLPHYAILCCILACLILWLLPSSWSIENRLGLTPLFQLRGERAPPDEVLLVYIDEDSMQALNTDDKVHLWNRSLHAQLIDKLNQFGAKLIIFDIAFKGPSDTEADNNLRTSLQNSNNVILIQDMMPIQYTEALIQTATRIKAPLAEFHNEAMVASFIVPTSGKQLLGFAPLYLDKIYKGQASIPVLALQHSNIQQQSWLVDTIQNLSHSHNNKIDTQDPALLAQTLHELFLQQVDLKAQVLEKLEQTFSQTETIERLSTLINVYSSTEPVYINYYGDKLHISHLPYYRIIKTGLNDETLKAQIKDKIIFVGRTYEQVVKQADTHYTPFTDAYGPGMSGVEIMSTVLANLLDNSSMRLLPHWQALLLILIWGLFCYYLVYQLNKLHAVGLIMLGGILYYVTAYFLFTEHYLIIPLAVPLFILAPCIIVCAILHYALLVRQKNQQTVKTLRHYLPNYAIKELTDNTVSLRNTHLIQGVCLLTDIKNFTAFSERYEASELHKIMNDYYRILNQEIETHGGQIANILGDGLLAIWASQHPQDLQQCKINACRAALSIQESIHNSHSSDCQQLITCIGIHYGSISLGDLGSDKHYAYAPVGDTVNTTAKIEAYNRIANTNILLSTEVLTAGMQTRKLGEISLKGKSKTIGLYELKAISI